MGDGRLGHTKSTLGKTILGFGSLGEDIGSGCSGLGAVRKQEPC